MIDIDPVIMAVIAGWGYFLTCIFWAWATHKILENKGYKNNWFLWGLIFGIFAYVVATTRKDQPSEFNNE
ncbi:MAG: hypothetical protein PHP22_04355 [Oscillospiraceae bacterium]|jgi:hypothetical protein|nr:hypothetical protein [Oscillospiraceae bacterium]